MTFLHPSVKRDVVTFVKVSPVTCRVKIFEVGEVGRLQRFQRRVQHEGHVVVGVITKRDRD